jgi:MFS family permease
VFNLVFNLYMSALGFSNEIIGIFNSLPAVALIAVGLPAAALVDRVGYRPFLLASAAMMLIGSVTLTAAGQRLIAVLAAGTFALGLILLQLLGNPLLTQISSERERVTLFSLNQSFSWIAVLLGDVLGGVIPEAAGRATGLSAAAAGSIRYAFAAMTALVLLGLPSLRALIRVAGVRPAAVMPIKQMLHVDVGRFTRLLIPEVILGLGAGMFLTFVQLYFAQRFGLTPGPIGVILAVGAALTAAGTLAAPSIGRRLGISRTTGVTQMIGCPLIVTLAFVTVLPLATVVFYLRQIALNIQAPLAMVFGMEYVAPEQRARLATALIVGNGIGSAGIGPLVSGFLQAAGGFQVAFSVAAVFYLLGGLSFLILFGGTRLPSEAGNAAGARRTSSGDCL